jgi:pyridoxal phosphate enzyme (YggS family)
MVELVKSVDPERVRSNLAEITERIAAAAPSGSAADSVEVVAATKYVPNELMPFLAEGGVAVAGENRFQDLMSKQEAHGDLFTWDFIGDLQSRKAPALVGKVRLIHSLGSISALERLERAESGGQEVLVQINIAEEESKSGVSPADISRFLESDGCNVVGLMTMPPFTETPEDSRRWFAALRELGDRHGLRRFSMGTSQDYEIAVSEGATMVRVGSVLWN